MVHHAVEGVHAEHERLGRALLGDGGHGVLPERDDPLLGEVVAELVEHHVELDVGALVDARGVGVERGAALDRRVVPLPVEEAPGDPGSSSAPVSSMQGSWKGAPGTGRPEPLVTKPPDCGAPLRSGSRERVVRPAAWNAMAAFSRSVPSSGNQTGAALWISFVMSRRLWVPTAHSVRAERPGAAATRRSRRGRGAGRPPSQPPARATSMSSGGEGMRCPTVHSTPASQKGKPGFRMPVGLSVAWAWAGSSRPPPDRPSHTR